jgi:putative membrane protein
MLHILAQPGDLWQIPVTPSIALALSGAIYIRGWFRTRKARPLQLPAWRAATFMAGMAVLFLVIASPIDTLADDLLLIHMSQHILLMSVIPPLLALGAPLVPLSIGAPKLLIRTLAVSVGRVASFHKLASVLSSPMGALSAMILSFVVWHIPVAYELALRSDRWHTVEHLAFLATSLIFWWKIVEPWPVRRPWSPWTKLACLIAADVANTAVSAYLSFCGHVIYPSYEHVGRAFGISALADQNGAGAEMWVINSLVFLIPAMVIPMRALAPRFSRRVGNGLSSSIANFRIQSSDT